MRTLCTRVAIFMPPSRVTVLTPVLLPVVAVGLATGYNGYARARVRTDVE